MLMLKIQNKIIKTQQKVLFTLRLKNDNTVVLNKVRIGTQ